jgi:hypothetical protein
VRVVDLSADAANARAVADASRDLTATEWGDLVARNGTCPPFVPPLDTAPDVVEPPFVPSAPSEPGR